ncbi:MAG: helix-turn-helix domain-containing protein [Halopenitus sp.]
MLQITFQTNPSGVLGRIHREIDGSSTAVDSVLQADEDDEWLAFLTVSDLEGPPDAAVEALPSVELLRSEAYTAESGTFMLLVRISGDSCIVQTIAQRRAVPHTVRLRGRYLEGTVSVEDWDHLQSIAGDIEASHGGFNLLSVNQVENMDAMLGSDRFKQATVQSLPPEHLRTIEVAYRAGYFDVPQSASASEVADELGISQSTFSERFRRSISSLLGVLFGDYPASPGEYPGKD